MACVNFYDPIVFQQYFWPDYDLYDKQVQIADSVVSDSDETFVVAANMMGKDFIAGLLAVWAITVHPVVRVVTTSVKDDHLRVLWGEINRFIDLSSLPNDRSRTGVLNAQNGGPLIVNHRDIRKRYRGKYCKISYLRGMVSERGEGMAGHHAPYTLGIIDEASGVDQLVYTQMLTWAKKMLVFGNANDCPLNHFFRKAIKEGDVKAA